MSDFYKKHSYWISLVKRFGEKNYAEDIVQDMYIKIHGKENITEAYIYFILRNAVMDLHRINKKITKVELLTDFEYIESEQQNEYSIEINTILAKINSWDWYDRKLFMIWIESKKSLRTIAKETSIPFGSIRGTIKNCKERLKNGN